MKKAKVKPLQLWGSMDLFTHLRTALRGVGLLGREAIGVGVYAVMESRFLPSPLRLEIEDRKQGTAAQIVQRGAMLVKPGSLVTIDPMSNDDWSQFAAAPNDKVVFIPRWVATCGKHKYAYLDLQNNKLTRIVGSDEPKKEKETVQEVEGRFACISAERALTKMRPRWLTLKGDALTTEVLAKSTLTSAEKDTWHEVDRLLRRMGRLPVRFPQWEELVLEDICSISSRAGQFIPAFLQSWTTVCMLRSFRYDLELERLKPSFSDLAAMTMLFPKALYREPSRFPSATKIFTRISQPGQEDGAQNPLSGKGRRYRRKPERLKIQPLFGDDAVPNYRWLDMPSK